MACCIAARDSVGVSSGTWFTLARISHQAARELEMNSLNLNKLSEIDLFTVCFTPRSFGADMPRAALGTFLPASLKLKAMPGGPETHPEPPRTRHHLKAW